MASKKVSQDIVKLCQHFAEKCYVTNIDEYSRRNQNDEEKIMHDIFIGKLAEFGVYFILLDKGINDITIPDISIYKSKNKSFDSDLKNKKYNFHIKTQTIQASKKFEESWLFQKNDPLVLKPKESDFFIGTQYNENEFEIKILLSKKVKNLKFEKPKLDKLFNKTCVYLKNNL